MELIISHNLVQLQQPVIRNWAEGVMCSCVQLSKKKKKKIESDEDEELCKMQRKMKGSAKCKEKRLSLNLDLILKFVTFSSALYHLLASDLNLEETKFRNILFLRSIWLPETIISFVPPPHRHLVQSLGDVLASWRRLL